MVHEHVTSPGPRILIVVNAEWYFWSHRLGIAKALIAAGCHVTLAAAEERGYGSRIAALGIRFVPLALPRRWGGGVRELGAVNELRRLYRRERPDLVHHVTIKPILYGSIAARLAGVPAVLNAIPGLGYMFLGEGLPGRSRRLAARFAYKMALAAPNSLVVFQNPEDRDWFVSRDLVRAEQCRLIRGGSGVDTDRFTPTPEPDGPPVVLLASRLIWDKGLAELVDASRLLRNRGVACRIALVGIPDSENPTSLLERLTAWQQEGAIEWWGLRDDMPAVLASASLVVLPSYREGLPKILLEAAASGRAAIATDVPGCREAVRDGETGLLVPPKDPVALASAIERLLRDVPLRQRMGRAARALAVREFSEADTVRQTLDAYRELLGEKWPVSAEQVTATRWVR